MHADGHPTDPYRPTASFAKAGLCFLEVWLEVHPRDPKKSSCSFRLGSVDDPCPRFWTSAPTTCVGH
jgi:hypothetical protein